MNDKEGEANREGIKRTDTSVQPRKQVGDLGLGYHGSMKDRRTEAGGDRQVKGELLPDITDFNFERKLQDLEKRGKKRLTVVGEKGMNRKS